MRPLSLFVLVSLLPHVASATPSPSEHTRDVLFGATERTYFVLQHQTIYPGSYYAYTERVWLVERSNWTNKIEERCLIREDAWQDVNANDEWAKTTQINECFGASFANSDQMTLANTHTVLAEPHKPINTLLSPNYTHARFAEALSVRIEELSNWFFDETCASVGSPAQVRSRPWVYVLYRCGTGDIDSQTHEIIVPISLKTWLGRSE